MAVHVCLRAKSDLRRGRTCNLQIRSLAPCPIWPVGLNYFKYGKYKSGALCADPRVSLRNAHGRARSERKDTPRMWHEQHLVTLRTTVLHPAHGKHSAGQKRCTLDTQDPNTMCVLLAASGDSKPQRATLYAPVAFLQCTAQASDTERSTTSVLVKRRGRSIEPHRRD